MRKLFASMLGVSLLVAACAGGDASEGTAGTDVMTTTTATSATEAEQTTTSRVVTSSTSASTTSSTLPPGEAGYIFDWDELSSPFWDPNAGSTADPFFFVHTQPDQDGFYFALEMYTTGYGALWKGELGDVDIICDEAAPAPNSTGICPHFDPDGSGPAGDLNADFAATGSITINKLDDQGYDIIVNEIVFSDGSRILGFRLTGP